jgi:hypothetical protein
VTSETYLRRVAGSLLRLALKVAPQDSVVWGQAALAELNYVKGDWPALAWAFGGAVVLTKRAMLSLILPGRRRTAISSKPEIFAKEGPMRKATLAAVGACAVASLLFFLAPVFRQAFQASLAQWHGLADFTPYADRRPSPELEAVAGLAEQNHDAEGLAFVAMRHPKESESARLADEAVQLDSNLTWVYAVVAMSYPTLPQIERWVPKIEQLDPENALPYFIVAEAIDIDQGLHDKVPKKTSDESPAWKKAMASAFQSPKLDNYLDRLKALDRRVILRYGFDDLYQALDNPGWFLLPSYSAWDSCRYAELVLQSGETLEARRDLTGARDRYLAVARFSQMTTPAGVLLLYGKVNIPQEAYKRLQAFSEKDGLQEQARLYASLAAQAERAKENDWIVRQNRFGDSDVTRWSANLVKTSGAAMFLCAGILLTCFVHVIRKRQFLKPNSRGLGRITTAFGIGGAVGLLLSSATLYTTYRPYAEIFQGYLHSGDESQLPLLSSFLDHTWVLLGSEGFYGDVRVYFWFAVSALCVLALLLAVITFVVKHLRPQDSI